MSCRVALIRQASPAAFSRKREKEIIPLPSWPFPLHTATHHKNQQATRDAIPP
jgi:hypothetical protein